MNFDELLRPTRPSYEVSEPVSRRSDIAKGISDVSPRSIPVIREPAASSRLPAIPPLSLFSPSCVIERVREDLHHALLAASSGFEGGLLSSSILLHCDGRIVGDDETIASLITTSAYSSDGLLYMTYLLDCELPAPASGFDHLRLDASGVVLLESIVQPTPETTGVVMDMRSDQSYVHMAEDGDDVAPVLLGDASGHISATSSHHRASPQGRGEIPLASRDIAEPEPGALAQLTASIHESSLWDSTRSTARVATGVRHGDVGLASAPWDSHPSASRAAASSSRSGRRGDVGDDDVSASHRTDVPAGAMDGGGPTSPSSFSLSRLADNLGRTCVAVGGDDGGGRATQASPIDGELPARGTTATQTPRRGIGATGAVVALFDAVATMGARGAMGIMDAIVGGDSDDSGNSDSDCTGTCDGRSDGGGVDSHGTDTGDDRASSACSGTASRAASHAGAHPDPAAHAAGAPHVQQPYVGATRTYLAAAHAVLPADGGAQHVPLSPSTAGRAPLSPTVSRAMAACAAAAPRGLMVGLPSAASMATLMWHAPQLHGGGQVVATTLLVEGNQAGHRGGGDGRAAGAAIHGDDDTRDDGEFICARPPALLEAGGAAACAASGDGGVGDAWEADDGVGHQSGDGFPHAASAGGHHAPRGSRGSPVASWGGRAAPAPHFASRSARARARARAGWVVEWPTSRPAAVDGGYLRAHPSPCTSSPATASARPIPAVVSAEAGGGARRARPWRAAHPPRSGHGPARRPRGGGGRGRSRSGASSPTAEGPRGAAHWAAVARAAGAVAASPRGGARAGATTPLSSRAASPVAPSGGSSTGSATATPDAPRGTRGAAATAAARGRVEAARGTDTTAAVGTPRTTTTTTTTTLAGGIVAMTTTTTTSIEAPRDVTPAHAQPVQQAVIPYRAPTAFMFHSPPAARRAARARARTTQGGSGTAVATTSCDGDGECDPMRAPAGPHAVRPWAAAHGAIVVRRRRLQLRVGAGAAAVRAVSAGARAHESEGGEVALDGIAVTGTDDVATAGSTPPPLGGPHDASAVQRHAAAAAACAAAHALPQAASAHTFSQAERPQGAGGAVGGALAWVMDACAGSASGASLGTGTGGHSARSVEFGLGTSWPAVHSPTDESAQRAAPSTEGAWSGVGWGTLVPPSMRRSTAQLPAAAHAAAAMSSADAMAPCSYAVALTMSDSIPVHGDRVGRVPRAASAHDASDEGHPARGGGRTHAAGDALRPLLCRSHGRVGTAPSAGLVEGEAPSPLVDRVRVGHDVLGTHTAVYEPPSAASGALRWASYVAARDAVARAGIPRPPPHACGRTAAAVRPPATNPSAACGPVGSPPHAHSRATNSPPPPHSAAADPPSPASALHMALTALHTAHAADISGPFAPLPFIASRPTAQSASPPPRAQHQARHGAARDGDSPLSAASSSTPSIPPTRAAGHGYLSALGAPHVLPSVVGRWGAAFAARAVVAPVAPVAPQSAMGAVTSAAAGSPLHDGALRSLACAWHGHEEVAAEVSTRVDVARGTAVRSASPCAPQAARSASPCSVTATHWHALACAHASAHAIVAPSPTRRAATSPPMSPPPHPRSTSHGTMSRLLASPGALTAAMAADRAGTETHTAAIAAHGPSALCAPRVAPCAETWAVDVWAAFAVGEHLPPGGQGGGGAVPPGGEPTPSPDGSASPVGGGMDADIDSGSGTAAPPHAGRRASVRQPSRIATREGADESGDGDGGAARRAGSGCSAATAAAAAPTLAPRHATGTHPRGSRRGTAEVATAAAAAIAASAAAAGLIAAPSSPHSPTTASVVGEHDARRAVAATALAELAHATNAAAHALRRLPRARGAAARRGARASGDGHGSRGLACGIRGYVGVGALGAAALDAGGGARAPLGTLTGGPAGGTAGAQPMALALRGPLGAARARGAAAVGALGTVRDGLGGGHRADPWTTPVGLLARRAGCGDCGAPAGASPMLPPGAAGGDAHPCECTAVAASRKRALVLAHASRALHAVHVAFLATAVGAPRGTVGSGDGNGSAAHAGAVGAVSAMFPCDAAVAAWSAAAAALRNAAEDTTGGVRRRAVHRARGARSTSGSDTSWAESEATRGSEPGRVRGGFVMIGSPARSDRVHVGALPYVPCGRCVLCAAAAAVAAAAAQMAAATATAQRWLAARGKGPSGACTAGALGCRPGCECAHTPALLPYVEPLARLAHISAPPQEAVGGDVKFAAAAAATSAAVAAAADALTCWSGRPRAVVVPDAMIAPRSDGPYADERSTDDAASPSHVTSGDEAMGWSLVGSVPASSPTAARVLGDGTASSAADGPEPREGGSGVVLTSPAVAPPLRALVAVAAAMARVADYAEMAETAAAPGGQSPDRRSPGAADGAPAGTPPSPPTGDVFVSADPSSAAADPSGTVGSSSDAARVALPTEPVVADAQPTPPGTLRDLSDGALAGLVADHSATARSALEGALAAMSGAVAAHAARSAAADCDAANAAIAAAVAAVATALDAVDSASAATLRATAPPLAAVGNAWTSPTTPTVPTASANRHTEGPLRPARASGSATAARPCGDAALVAATPAAAARTAAAAAGRVATLAVAASAATATARANVAAVTAGVLTDAVRAHVGATLARAAVAAERAAALLDALDAQHSEARHDPTRCTCPQCDTGVDAGDAASGSQGDHASARLPAPCDTSLNVLTMGSSGATELVDATVTAPPVTTMCTRPRGNGRTHHAPHGAHSADLFDRDDPAASAAACAAQAAIIGGAAQRSLGEVTHLAAVVVAALVDAAKVLGGVESPREVDVHGHSSTSTLPACTCGRLPGVPAAHCIADDHAGGSDGHAPLRDATAARIGGCALVAAVRAAARLAAAMVAAVPVSPPATPQRRAVAALSPLAAPSAVSPTSPTSGAWRVAAAAPPAALRAAVAAFRRAVVVLMAPPQRRPVRQSADLSAVPHAARGHDAPHATAGAVQLTITAPPVAAVAAPDGATAALPASRDARAPAMCASPPPSPGASPSRRRSVCRKERCGGRLRAAACACVSVSRARTPSRVEHTQSPSRARTQLTDTSPSRPVSAARTPASCPMARHQRGNDLAVAVSLSLPRSPREPSPPQSPTALITPQGVALAGGLEGAQPTQTGSTASPIAPLPLAPRASQLGAGTGVGTVMSATSSAAPPADAPPLPHAVISPQAPAVPLVLSTCSSAVLLTSMLEQSGWMRRSAASDALTASNASGQACCSACDRACDAACGEAVGAGPVPVDLHHTVAWSVLGVSTMPTPQQARGTSGNVNEGRGYAAGLRGPHAASGAAACGRALRAHLVPMSVSGGFGACDEDGVTATSDSDDYDDEYDAIMSAEWGDGASARAGVVSPTATPGRGRTAQGGALPQRRPTLAAPLYELVDTAVAVRRGGGASLGEPTASLATDLVRDRTSDSRDRPHGGASGTDAGAARDALAALMRYASPTVRLAPGGGFVVHTPTDVLGLDGALGTVTPIGDVTGASAHGQVSAHEDARRRRSARRDAGLSGCSSMRTTGAEDHDFGSDSGSGSGYEGSDGDSEVPLDEVLSVLRGGAWRKRS